MAKKPPPNFAAEPGPALHSARWRFGDFELDEGKRELRRGSMVVELEPKPLNMLMLMLRHPGELITKNDLMEALWTGRIVTESVLSNCAAKLRSVLGDDDQGARMRTVHGYGYRLEATPELLAAEAPIIEAPLLLAETPVPFRPNWVLKRRLGQSGETWLAAQVMTGEQRVFKFAHTPRQLSSLKREVTLYRLLRQTLEDRAAVVDLLDWNFDEPPWFIEVEYCELGSLAEYLESLGGAKALPMEQRIQLVIQLADALAAVHSVGILHKDLKPANILIAPGIGDNPRLRLCDFGSGRLLDFARLESLAITRLGFTQFAESGGSSTSGTPLYYAPEVLSGQPATLKADIYALGVIFYQLMVGDMRRLFAPGWESGIADELIREDIAAASAGNPYERLTDAAQLAQRLRNLPQRHEARRLETAERAATATTALALQKSEARRAGYRLAAITLALGLLVGAVLLVKALEARRDAEAAAHRANTVTDFLLKDVLEEVSNEDRPPQSLTIKELLDTAANDVGKRFGDQPLLQPRIRTQLARAFSQLGFHAPAKVQYDLALTQLSIGSDADPVEIMEVLSELLHEDYLQGLLPERFDRHYAHAQTRIAQLGNAHPKSVNLRENLVLCRYLLGQWLQAEQEGKALVPDLLRANMGARFEHRLRMVRVYALVDLEDWRAALALLNSDLPAAKAAYGADHIEVARNLVKQAQIAIAQGQHALAQRLLDEAAPLIARWEPAPGSLTLLRQQLLIEQALLRNEWPRAERLIEQGMGYLATTIEPGPNEAELFLVKKAQLRLKQLRFDEAQQLLAVSIPAAESYQSAAHPRVQWLRLLLAEAQLNASNWQAATQTLSVLVPQSLEQLPEYHSVRSKQRLLSQWAATQIKPNQLQPLP